MTSPYLREFIRPIENLFNYAGYADSETPYYCMLLVTNRQYLGYIRDHRRKPDRGGCLRRASPAQRQIKQRSSWI